MANAGLIKRTTLEGMAEQIRSLAGIDNTMTPEEMVEVLAALVAGGVTPMAETQTYILEDEDGNEVPAVLVSEETVFTATANDIRLGTVAATAEGVTEGTKDIPAWHTTEGTVYVPAGSSFTINLPDGRHDYTKLQAIICAYSTSMASSVAAEKVAINDNVYPVGSTEIVAAVTVDDTTKTINLGITNEGTTPCVIRYFTYKEEQ